jgi:hypothetical protein
MLPPFLPLLLSLFLTPKTVLLDTGEKLGTGCLIGNNRVLTAKHVIDGEDSVEWSMSPIIHGPARILSKQKEDVAVLLLLSGNFPVVQPMRIAPTMPASGDPVTIYGRILGNREVVVHAFAFIENDGNLYLDGLSITGMSGACVMNDEGELVGVLHGTAVIVTNPPAPMRAMVVVTPVVGKRF